MDTTYYDGTDSNVFGTNRNSQQESATTEVQLLYCDLDWLRSAYRVMLLVLVSDRSFFGLQRLSRVEQIPSPHSLHDSEI